MCASFGVVSASRNFGYELRDEVVYFHGFTFVACDDGKRREDEAEYRLHLGQGSVSCGYDL